ncbi:T-complex protein 11-domain-containing protein [Flammula alnicola]|nr:T-complex protein 11-domain-containing protein [Flammula alnicola]
MDDLAHRCPLNHRKRKADQDDCQDLPSVSDQAVVSSDSPSGVAGPSCNAPRQQWITETDDKLWASPNSPQVSSPLTSQVLRGTKRPRIDTHESTLRAAKRPYPRRSPSKMSPSPLTSVRQGSDIEDIGIVSTAHPGPSSGSLLRERHSVIPGVAPPRVVHILSTAAQSPIKFNSPHIPPTQPLINRQTLRELELDVILRNPVIRHDLLFDPGLQFRPRRKREMFEKYWNAVWEEVQTGCTCVTLDTQGNCHPKACICARHPTTPPIPIVSQISKEDPTIYTIRMPSRIPALLSEFLQVMLLVIQPLSNTAVYTNPTAVREQAQEHSAHAAYLESIFDPALIEQELKHKVFDPSGLFSQIGETLKHHCAPMRDRAVEEMVQVAQRPGPEAFTAVRMCLELLELMKLDIANHQLTQLRPWLLRNTGIFEVKAFKIRFGTSASLHNTREWLHNANVALFVSKKQPIPHPSYPNGLTYPSLTKNQQIYLCCLKGIVNTIFETLSPPSSPVSSTSDATPPPSPVFSSLTPSPSPTPETLYLDKTRMALISAEATDVTALYMFILLFRQLVVSDVSESSGSTSAKVDQSDVMRVKREIRDIGPACLGTCFVSSAPALAGGEAPPVDNDLDERRNVKRDLALQIAQRASEVRRRGSAASSTIQTADSDDYNMSLGGDAAPDAAIVSLAQRWTDTNMQPESALSGLLHKRVRDAVFEEVVGLAYPSAAAAGVGAGVRPSLLSMDLFAAGGNAFARRRAPDASAHVGTTGTHAAGMESLTEEVRKLAEKIARLALVHLNTHLSMYESEGFLGL